MPHAFDFNNVQDIKRFAISLTQFLKKQNTTDIKQSLILEGIAQSMGYKHWNIAKAVLEKNNPHNIPIPVEAINLSDLHDKWYQAVPQLSQRNEAWLDTSLESFFEPLFNKIKNSKIYILSSLSDEITQAFIFLPAYQMFEMLHYMDEHFPGISFHYVMEAYNSTSYYGQAFLNRLYFLKTHDKLGLCFSPMRQRLISGLLNATDEYYIDVHQYDMRQKLNSLMVELNS